MSPRAIAPGAATAEGSSSRAPARSIREAIEQLIGADEAEDAVAEWARGER